MGKKTLKDKTVGGLEDDPNATGLQEPLTFEKYQCTGDLEHDYPMLCTLMGYIEYPKLICRPPTQITYPRSPTASEKNFIDDSDVASQKSEQSHISDKLDKSVEATKTALELIEERFSSLKPNIYVDWETKNGRLVRKISIRGWKIEEKMICLLAKCLPPVVDLYTLSLWNVGLTDDTFSSFLSILPQCPDLKVFSLEGNPLQEQSYYKLISADLPLAYISLRNNNINDEGARLISQSLQNMDIKNKSLISLVLSFNHIGNVGANYIAEALRLNRSLLVLNLSNNLIEDKGALALAEVVGYFALTHKELVERRRMLMEKTIQEMQKSPVKSRRKDSKSERSQSHQSNMVNDKAQAKPSKSSQKKKDKEQQKKEDKSTANNLPNKKEDPKAKKQTPNTDQKSVRAKTVKSASKTAPLPEPEPEPVTPIENLNPLLENAESKNGKVYLMGNRVLINLNLLRNKITEIGLKGFLNSMETQMQETKLIPGTKLPTGLLRLSLRNNFPVDCATFLKLEQIMQSRDPLRQSAPSVTEEEVKEVSLH
ncbi:leucine-rich repeat-containing protein 71 isoform X2 [Bombina bombina]|uniref:leucine-rich repeat-containing protein 71 isoform X2 n=1 Tax=Bombina bombina TaxID=8345 RepID=UPI00235AB274|nr:leucine-rich repeat-containing protein 71 isoform X2 [Bombina bombina]